MTAWRDQVALVTGGARGIGRATARLLAQRGAAVCVNYAAHGDAADGLAGEIVANGGRVVSAMADVGETAAIDAVVARIEKESGPLTILVNNAGVSWQGTLFHGRLAFSSLRSMFRWPSQHSLLTWYSNCSALCHSMDKRTL